MKKLIALLFCLCVSLVVFCPGIVMANPTVDASCQACHDAGFGEGTLHGTHTGQACDICHTSASGGDTPVASSKCIVCHPVGNEGLCPLANAHGSSCLECHTDCAPVTTTTTTIAAEGHGANGIVDETNCLASGCHVVGSLGAADGSLHGEHSDCAACHDGTPAAGNVFASSCVVCHPVGNAGACPLVNAHEAAGADCLSCHSTCQAQAEVAISPANVNLAPGATQSFQATTTGGDNPPVYTWDLSASGGTADTTTGDTITYIAGPNPGSYTITVTDTANGNIEATATVLIGELCNIGVLDESVRKSHWVALPALIRIQTAGADVSQATQVTFTSDAEGAFKSVIPLVKLVNPTSGIIYQLAIIPPAIATGNFDAESETITVAVEGCDKTDTFDLDFLSLGPIPLSK